MIIAILFLINSRCFLDYQPYSMMQLSIKMLTNLSHEDDSNTNGSLVKYSLKREMKIIFHLLWQFFAIYSNFLQWQFNWVELFESRPHNNSITWGTVLVYIKSKFMEALPSIVFDLARTPSAMPELMASFLSINYSKRHKLKYW